jgi:signal peptidase I
MHTRHARKLVSVSLGLIVLGCLWFFLAPTALGGSTSYVVTDGVSMEPHFHTGDLVMVRSQSTYHVGEIVAYHSKMFHTVVLHRIIGRDGSRYVFKGDNNNFTDFEHPAASQLMGALWLHLPGAGGTLHSLRSPALIAILVAVGTLLLTGATFTRRRRRRRRQRRAEADGAQHTAVHHLPQGSSEHVIGVLAIGLVALLPFVALALLAFTRPTTASLPFNVPYQQSATVSYSANASPGPAYDNGEAVTGDPLFTHLVRSVDFNFDYLFHSATKHSLTGKAWIDATVASSSGWHTTLALGHPAYFHGDKGHVSGALDLSSLLALLHSVASTTAVNGSYTLALVPHVSTSGSIGSTPLHTTFAPRIQFSLGELELQPVVPGGGSSTQSAASPFAPSLAGSVTGRHAQPRYLSLLVAKPSVASARAIALSGIVIVICVLSAMVVFVRPRRRDEAAAIKARYGWMIVPVARVWQLPGAPVIDVDDMESLVRIAEHYDRSILHETLDAGEAFWVTDESGQFRYAVGASGRMQPTEPAPSERDAGYALDAIYAEAPTVVEYVAELVDAAVQTEASPAQSEELQAPYAEPVVEPGFPIEVQYAEPAEAAYPVAAQYQQPVVVDQPPVASESPGLDAAPVAVGQGVLAQESSVAQQEAASVYLALAPQVEPMASHSAPAQALQPADVGAGAQYPAPEEIAEIEQADRLSGEVYADELELGGVIAAFGTQTEPATVEPSATQDAREDELSDTLIQGWHAAYEVAQVGRGPVVRH